MSFARFVVKSRWIIIAVFAVLLVVCCVMISFNKVNYDLSQYLPKESGANVAMNVLKEEFDDKGMLYVMVKGVSSAEEATTVQKEIAALDGIGSASFDPTTGYVNGAALYTVMLTDYDATDNAFDATEGLLEYLETKDAYITGQSAYTYYTRLETEESLLKVGVIIVVAILLMLFFTSRTYFELVPLILVFGVSVGLNIGTNFWFNGISYVANLISIVLQLALSIDYSVILIHRYMEEREKESDPVKAATNALAKGAIEVMSSSLTTIAGLASLLLMTLPIGVEIGLSLAKSIVFSMIAVIFLMPALLVLFDKPISKSKHKFFVPKITRPARAIVRARKVIVPLFLVLIVLAGVGQSYNLYSFNMNGGSKIVEPQEAIKPYFGTLNSLVVIVPKGDYEKERELADHIMEKELIDSVTALSTIEVTDGVYLTDSLTKAEFVSLFTSMMGDTDFGDVDVNSMIETIFDDCYAELNPNAQTPEASRTLVLADALAYVYSDFRTVLPAEYADMLGQLVTARSSLESENYARLTFNIDGAVESDETFALISEIKAELGDYYSEAYLTGESVVCYDMAHFFPTDNLVVSICIIVFILIILFATFRNFLLPLILVVAIQGGIWINFAIPAISGSAVSFIAYLIISAIQMGATIDYAIVLTNRYETEKHNYADRLTAMAESENAVFPTIITSGVILTVTGFTLGIASSGVVAKMGMLLGIGTLTSMLVVLLVLPSLLLVCDGVYSKAGFSSVLGKLKRKNVAVANGETTEIVTEESAGASEDVPATLEESEGQAETAAEEIPQD